MSTFQGKRVSRTWAIILNAAWDAGVRFQLNSGQRLMAEQAALVREKGLWSPSNDHGAAAPSTTAPHIRAGHEHHALDVNADGGHTRLAAWLRAHGIPVAFNVPGEPWHLDPVSEPALVELAQRIRWHGYTASERRWIVEYDHLRKVQVVRRGTLRRVMMLQRKRIWRAAQEPGGWDKSNRRARYASLKARTA